VFIPQLVKRRDPSNVDIAMSAFILGFDELFEERPYQLVVNSTSSRWIAPMRYNNEAGVVFLSSISAGFKVVGKELDENKTYYYLVEELN
jgi:hypothetical protein